MQQILNQLEEDEIDRQFAAMADDGAYQELNLAMAESFAESDWEAFLDGERGNRRFTRFSPVSATVKDYLKLSFPRRRESTSPKNNGFLPSQE